MEKLGPGRGRLGPCCASRERIALLRRVDHGVAPILDSVATPDERSFRLPNTDRNFGCRKKLWPISVAFCAESVVTDQRCQGSLAPEEFPR